MNWELPIVAAAQTDTGMRRSNNQDSYAIVQVSNPEKWRRRGHVFVVADGMGAHAVGELASKMACENIPHNYNKIKNATPAEAVVQAYREVGSLIHGKASANRDFQGMGTTCSTLILLPEGALLAHVGDSRIYRIRRSRVEQLTFDHSLAWELVRQNHLTKEQAQRAVPRNVITRSLGPDPVVEVDVEGPYQVEVGDVYLLCSDGLSGPVTDPELGALAAHCHPEHAARYLVHLANLRGGMDNITTVIVRIGSWAEPGQEDATATAEMDPPRRGGKFRLGSLLSGLQRRPARPAAVEEHVYRSADCPIDDALLNRLSEDVRGAQAIAIEQAWHLDWSLLSNLRRDVEEARASGDFAAALRKLGEVIVLLGQAGRLHRKELKESGANGSH